MELGTGKGAAWGLSGYNDARGRARPWGKRGLDGYFSRSLSHLVIMARRGFRFGVDLCGAVERG